MMKRNAREGGIRSRLVAVTAAAALLVASVATGTAVAAEDVPEETQPQVAAQTLDAVRNDDATPGDAVDSGDQTDAAVQNGGDAGTVGGDGSDNDAAANDDEPADGGAADGENADKQTAVDGNAAADDRDADGGSSDDVTPDTGATVSARVLEDHTVAGVSPLGTKINLFDYDNGGTNGNINDERILHFGGGITVPYDAELNTNNVNAWTGAKGSMKPAPRQGIVQNKLGSDGYPTLDNVLGGSSLKYLFNRESVPGKTSYMGVDGLLQIDDGYYYYNSQDNFAQFNSDETGSGSFTLYDTWGVMPVGTSPNGQFFPFNTGGQVFEEQGGKLVQKSGLKSGNNSIFNHYFGLSMSTRFVQQYGGHVDQNKEKPVTYNFSGDDDVWVYIDGVLVGDLGGIHDQVSLQINFATGEVVVYSDGRIDNRSDNIFNSENAIDGTDPDVTAERIGNAIDNGEDVYWQKTTLKQLFKDAGVTSADSWATNTLPDNTYHTLDFFYMERGGSDSNMALRYNLVSIPETGIVKIDQDGKAMSGIEFTLHQANKQPDGVYQSVKNGMTVTGTTDDNGDLILTHKNVGGATGTPYSLDELGDVSRYWILTENNTPAGYRGVQPVHLYFAYEQTGNKNLGTGPLLVDNQWDTGAYSAPHVTVQADATVSGTNGSKFDLDKGTLFAVVMKHIDSNNNGTFEKGETTWAPVSGDAFEGWTVYTSGDQQQNIITAAQKNSYIFTPGTNGSYETTIEDLPGDIKTYRYMIQEHQNMSYDDAMATASYSVAYFYTIGDLSAHAGSEHAVTSKNTWQINSEGGSDSRAFDRIFSVTLNVPNIKNELSLEKTDATTGKPMSGVDFKLYNADGNGDPTGDALNTLTTGEDGTLQVYTNTSNQILAKGNYVLVETVPNGYIDQNTSIPVVVDDSGVYADAGATDDNVTVETGLGTLVYSMKGFAAGDQVDATLHDVKAQPQNADTYSGVNTVWTPDGDELHLQYVDKNNRTLNYQGTGDGATTHTATAGWSTLTVTQCMEVSHQPQESGLVKQNLGDTDLSALFTGDVTIVVKNYPYPTVAPEVQKELKGRDWQDGDSFTFTLTAAEGNPEGGATLPDNAGALTIDNSTEDHKAKFGDIIFSNAGNYFFTIQEKPNVEDEDTETPGIQHNGITYSQAVYQLNVVVTKDENTGKLTAESTMTLMKDQDGSSPVNNTVNGNVVVFVNRFAVSKLPLTGDGMTARNALLIGGSILLLAGAAWLLARRRRV